MYNKIDYTPYYITNFHISIMEGGTGNDSMKINLKHEKEKSYKFKCSKAFVKLSDNIVRLFELICYKYNYLKISFMMLVFTICVSTILLITHMTV